MINLHFVGYDIIWQLSILVTSSMWPTQSWDFNISFLLISESFRYQKINLNIYSTNSHWQCKFVESPVVHQHFYNQNQPGWWLTYPAVKYESQLGLLFATYGKIKNVPNHQPATITNHRFGPIPHNCGSASTSHLSEGWAPQNPNSIVNSPFNGLV